MFDQKLVYMRSVAHSFQIRIQSWFFLNKNLDPHLGNMILMTIARGRRKIYGHPVRLRFVVLIT